MSLDVKYNPERNVFYRIWDHTNLGLRKNIGDRTNTPRNIVEKGGDGMLWTVGLLPRAVKAIAKSFQDPRVLTVVLTALALFATSLAFYPVTTILATKATWTFGVRLITQIPFWAVKFSAYLATCATIIGAGLRAGGRFNNAALMKEYYDIPSSYPNNPARLYASEIMQVRTVTA